MNVQTRSHQHPSKYVCHDEHTLWGSGSEAAESESQWNECVKNPGHENFIPVRDVGLHHLPIKWQRDDLIDYIKICSDLTVRVRVMDTSPARPDRGVYNPSVGGQRVGTGWVWMVAPTTGPCPCINCTGQSRQGQRSWTLCISTARHVVYDDTECAMTCVDFFHDQCRSREGDRIKTLRGGKVEYTEDKYDWCEFTCVTHNGELVTRLINQVNQRRKLHNSLEEWLTSLWPRLVICLSHPHGRPKYVTVGEYQGLELDSGMETYTTPTCPGSSGSRLIGCWARWGPHHCQRGGQDGLNKGWRLGAVGVETEWLFSHFCFLPPSQ